MIRFWAKHFYGSITPDHSVVNEHPWRWNTAVWEQKIPRNETNAKTEYSVQTTIQTWLCCCTCWWTSAFQQKNAYKMYSQREMSTYLFVLVASSVTPQRKSTSNTLMKCCRPRARSSGKTKRVSRSRSPCMSRNVEEIKTRAVRHLTTNECWCQWNCHTRLSAELSCFHSRKNKQITDLCSLITNIYF